jgi:hypothetical protein
MHDYLFEHQRHLGDADLLRYGAEIGLNTDRYYDELMREVYASRVSADLVSGMPLVPNSAPEASHIQVEFDLTTMDKNASPTLGGFQIAWRCVSGG